jgi:hypothetical protein
MSEKNEFAGKAKDVFDVVEEATRGTFSYGGDPETYAIEATQKILEILAADDQTPSIESYNFVQKYYRMNPEIEDILFDGTELENGMKVLIEDQNFRQNITLATAMNPEAFDNALRMNRWMEVQNVTVKDNIVEFIGRYDDNTKSKHRFALRTAWLVKKDSILDPTEYQELAEYAAADVQCTADLYRKDGEVIGEYLEADVQLMEAYYKSRGELDTSKKTQPVQSTDERPGGTWMEWATPLWPRVQDDVDMRGLDKKRRIRMSAMSSLMTDMAVNGATPEVMAPVIEESMRVIDERGASSTWDFADPDKIPTDPKEI